MLSLVKYAIILLILNFVCYFQDVYYEFCPSKDEEQSYILRNIKTKCTYHEFVSTLHVHLERRNQTVLFCHSSETESRFRSHSFPSVEIPKNEDILLGVRRCIRF